VTNGEYLKFVEAGGYRDERWWDSSAWDFIRREEIEAPGFWQKGEEGWCYRGLFETVPLPTELPVYASHIEALAFTRWRGCRLPTELEWHAAANSAAPPESLRDNFDFSRSELAPAQTNGGSPAQLTGNGWEWTSTPFAGFPGFRAFDHYPDTPPTSSTTGISC
jgi:formylglycine-generating enzyme required for sulfatase activity